MNLPDMKEYVILVDEQDEEIGLEEKLTAHQKGLLHRAFSIFVYRKKNNGIEFLLQQRQQNKYHCGGLWTNTCCSHPRANESILNAASRRLKEEMSLDIPLTVIGKFQYKATFENGLTEYEWDHVLIGEYQAFQEECHFEPLFEPTEVQAIQWVSFEKLNQDLSLNPKAYTPWLQPALKIVQEKLCLNY